MEQIQNKQRTQTDTHKPMFSSETRSVPPLNTPINVYSSTGALLIKNCMYVPCSPLGCVRVWLIEEQRHSPGEPVRLEAKDGGFVPKTVCCKELSYRPWTFELVTD